MAAQALEPIDCSVQPLDFAFHPSKDILAAALVDGTVECKIILVMDGSGNQNYVSNQENRI